MTDTTHNTPITREEMMTLFGEYMPIEAVNLVFNAPPEKTLGDIRRELRKIARKKNLHSTGTE